jgi:hypothetical protein
MSMKAFGETCPIMKLAIQADMEVRAVALARMAVFMISTGLPVRMKFVELFVNLLNPGKGSNAHGKEQVIDVDTGDEPDALGSSAGAIFERFCHDSRTDKHRASDDVPTNQGNPSADFVKEKDTHDLTDNSNRIVDTVD